MAETRFFDDVAAVGDEVLDQLQGRSDASQFLLRVRDVYRLLVEIHDDIVNASVDVGAAKTVAEARSILRSLHHDSLEAVFRARRWCDDLEALGKDLSSLPAGTNLSDPRTWNNFTTGLREREGEVAMLYEDSLYDVLGRAESASSLAEVQEYMSKVSEELVVQKAKFDYLAKRAAAIARRR